jgi:hypothetical protein
VGASVVAFFNKNTLVNIVGLNDDEVKLKKKLKKKRKRED